MSFRQRLTLLTALAIAVTVAGASFAVWVVAKHELYTQLDQTLIVQAQAQSRRPLRRRQTAYTVVIHQDGDVTGARRRDPGHEPGQGGRDRPGGYSSANLKDRGTPARELSRRRPDGRR